MAFNVVGSFIQGQQAAQGMRDAQQINQLRALQMQQAQAQMARDEQFRNELATYLQGGSENLAALYAADPERAMQVQQFQAQQNQLARQQRIEQAKQSYAAAQYVLSSNAPKTLAEVQFPQVVEQLKKSGYDWESATDDDVRAIAEQIAAETGSLAGILPERGEAFTLGEGQTRFDARGRPIASVPKVPSVEDAQKREQTIFERANTLRDEYDTQSKEFQTATQAYQRVLSAARDPSPAGDLALIFSYMRTLDPGSSVREGEFANAENAGGVPARIRAQYNKVISGERLSAEQRADFVTKAGQLYSGQLEIENKRREKYAKLAQRAGVDPLDVIGEAIKIDVPVSALGVGQTTEVGGFKVRRKK